MMRFLNYARLQIKRIAHYVPFVFAAALVLGICISAALVILVDQDNSKDNQKKITLGLVGNFDNSLVDFGIEAIKTMDSTRFFLEIEELGEDEAREKLFDEEISAYVIIDQEFVDEAVAGRVGKIKYFTSEANSEIVNLFREEVLELISRILVESQNGVYGMQNLLLENGFKRSEVYKITDEMAIEYVGLIISRSNAVEIEIIGVSENLTLAGYILSGLIVLLVLLIGLVCAPLFARRDYALQKLLCANRYGSTTQIAGEYLSFFVIMGSIALSITFAMLVVAVGKTQAVIPELGGISTFDAFVILIKFIPAIALITSLQYLLYQLADSIISGVLVQFISAVVLGYLSGCFYPISFFPDAIRLVSDLLPTGMARGYFSSLLSGATSPWNALIIVAYSALLLALSGYIRHRRIIEA